MTPETPWTTPDEKNEAILRAMAAANGGVVIEDPGGHMRLLHDVGDLLKP